jgi:hypothetical protein
MVDLNPLWVQSLQQRQEYHETSGIDDPKLPKQLKLSTFLKYGELRPASRKMLQLAYQASHSKEILALLNADLDAALTFSDVVTILRRDGIDLLQIDDASKSPTIDFHRIEENLRRLKGDGAGGSRRVSNVVIKARGTILQGAGLTPQQEKRLSIVSTSVNAARDKVLRLVSQIPKLCEVSCVLRRKHDGQ